MSKPAENHWGRVGFTLSVLALGVFALVQFRDAEVDHPRAPQQAQARAVSAGRPPTIVDLTGVRVLGGSNAVVTLIEFSDYECPFCIRHHAETMPKIEAAYIQTGRIRYAFRDWPVDELHPEAIQAHRAAHCAGEQGKYWEMHHRMFSRAGTHKPDQLMSLAGSLGLDEAAFKTCVNSGRFDGDIRATTEEAGRLGATGTPTFFVGRYDPATHRVTIENGIGGAQPYEVFARALDALLAKTP